METTATPATLESLQAQIGLLLERQRKQEELFAEITPILREVMTTAVGRLDDFEKRGWFAFARELRGVGEKILEHYGAEDVRAFGDAVVGILDAVRALTQPQVMSVLTEAAGGLENPEVEPIGLFGVMRASRDAEVQKGLAVLMELLRRVGRATDGAPRKALPDEGRKARLAKALAPRRTTPVAAPMKQLPAKTSSVGSPMNDGYLADPSTWTPGVAERLAAEEGIALGAEHWKVIQAARADFEKNHVAANIRRLTQIAGMDTRQIYTLFPKAPGRTIARLAGTPKPAGCL